MADLTIFDRSTRKRNALLQRRLQIQLQIMGDEYRLIRNDLDIDTRDLSDFLIYIRRTVPGLSGYDQPDSRSMKAAKMMLTQRCQVDKTNGVDEVLHSNKKEDMEINNKCGGGKEKSIDNDIKSEDKFTSSVSSSKDNFSRRGETFDKESRFLHPQHTVTRNKGVFLEYGNTDAPRKTRAGSSDRKEVLEEFQGSRRSAAVPQSRHTGSPKYGREAYTQQDERLSRLVISRFETIFDLPDKKHKDMISFNKPKSCWEEFPKGQLEAVTLSQPLLRRSLGKPVYFVNPNPASLAKIPQKRLIWSAPHRYSSRSVPSEENLNQQLQDDSLQNGCTTFDSDHAVLTAQQRPTSVRSMTSLDQYVAKIRFQKRQSLKSSLRRPKTAPQPNYELKQKSIPAPRQQLAGFLADVNSKGADTRVILKKSRQLQQMVKRLASSEQSDDSSSD